MLLHHSDHDGSERAQRSRRHAGGHNLSRTHVGGISVRVSIYKHGQPVEEGVAGKDGPCNETSASVTSTSHTYVHPVEVIAEGIQKNSQANKMIPVSKHGA